MSDPQKHTALLLILDGWGHREETDHNAIQLTITDQGPGIPKKDQATIFKRFHRLGNELRRETQGTGIGLSIVKHIAEAHGGGISVESTPPNGSTFTLTLPGKTVA